MPHPPTAGGAFLRQRLALCLDKDQDPDQNQDQGQDQDTDKDLNQDLDLDIDLSPVFTLVIIRIYTPVLCPTRLRRVGLFKSLQLLNHLL